MNYNQQQQQNERFNQLLGQRGGMGQTGITNDMLRDTSYTGGYGGGGTDMSQQDYAIISGY
jgi:hypothetical protein